MMCDIAISIHSRDETGCLGRLIASLLKPGDVVGLTGDLGAGKTFLAGEIAHALGIPENVSISSPTFTIIKEYRQGRLPVYHMDLYRLGDSSELYELGLWEYYEGDGVCLVEWSNMFDDLWPESALVVHIALRQNEERIITLNGNLRGRNLAVKLGDMWSKR